MTRTFLGSLEVHTAKERGRGWVREEILHLCDFFDNQTNHSPSSQSSHCCCNVTSCVMGTGEFVCGNLLVFCKLFFNTVITMVSFVIRLSYRIARHLRELSVALLVARFGFLPNVVPYSRLFWRALKLANWSKNVIGKF